MSGWFRPFRRAAWRLRPEWRRVHLFMSTQALGLGTATLTVLIAIDAGRGPLLWTLGITAAMVIYGTMIEQPEVHDDAED